MNINMTREEVLGKIKELEDYIQHYDDIWNNDEIFLLSCDEYKHYKSVIPECKTSWWLRDTNDDNTLVSFVNNRGNNQKYFMSLTSNYLGIRPVIRIYPSTFNYFEAGEREYYIKDYAVGDEFCFNKHSFTIIDDDLAIATVPISFDSFSDTANPYADSTVRRYLNNWFNA